MQSVIMNFCIFKTYMYILADLINSYKDNRHCNSALLLRIRGGHGV